MRLSKRIQGLTGGKSDGWGVFYRARQLARQGEPVVELTIGEHDIRTDPAILDAMHAAATGGHTGYADLTGTAALRQAVAARIARRTGVATGPENVLITPGGQSALFAAHHAALDPGDRALFIDPYYATYPGTLRGAGAVPVAVAARPEDGFQPRAEAVDAAAETARSILLNSPNNPTGVVYSEETLARLGEVARARDLWIISDEVYDSQVWEGAHVSPRALPGLEERTLVVGSMSKGHAMTGSRCGWIVGPREAIAHLGTLSLHTTYGVPGFIQDAAAFALSLGPDFEARIAAPFAARREITKRLIDKQNLVRMVPSGGAMYVMLDIRPTGLSGEEFAWSLLEAERVAVMPGESFGEAAAGHVRVAMTVADDRYAAALDRLLAHAATLAQEHAHA